VHLYSFFDLIYKYQGIADGFPIRLR
jgi:hypothetical protein